MARLSFPKQWELITPPYAKNALFLSYCVTLVITIVAGAYFLFAQPILPIFYTLPRDTQILAPKAWLFLFPSLSLAMSITHTVLAHVFRKFEPILLTLFVRAGLGIQIVLLASLIRIVAITL